MARESEQPRTGEFEIIARHFAPLASDGSFGLLDDAALLTVAPGKSLVIAQGAIAAGVHFFPDDSAGTIASKALRVSLSDLAAKGATPIGFSLALGLPDGWTESWVAEFARELGKDCRDYSVKLAGGNTFRSPGGAMVSITAWGEIDPRDYKSRLGAAAGDRLYVTGTLGDAALGRKVR